MLIDAAAVNPDPVPSENTARVVSPTCSAPSPARPARTAKYSFDEFCVPLYDEMLNFARRLTDGDMARAGDIVQDSMLKALNAWPRWVPEGEPAAFARAWLYRIVSNTFIKRYHAARVLKRRHANLHEDIIEAMWSQQNDISSRVDQLPRHGLSDEVLRALDKLSVDHREVVIKHYIDGMSCGDIGAELGIPKRTVFTRLKRAREMIEKDLTPYAAKEYSIRRSAKAAPSTDESGD